MRTRALISSLVAALIALPAAVATADVPAVRPHPGAPGAGDPYFPLQGNGGYDVAHYDLRINYHPKTHRLTGHEVIRATATTALSRFDLDLRRFMHADTVRVDGRPATATQPRALRQELVITPARPIPAGHTFHVTIEYAGRPHAVHDPDGSLDGFIRTGDGAFVASEPQGSPTWFAVNDTPRDKAAYVIAINVPKGLTAVGNGQLSSYSLGGRRSNFVWTIGRPISSYLVTATIGRFVVRHGWTRNRVPYYTAVDPREAQAAKVLRKLPAIIDFFSRKYGKYPFGAAGAIVDHAPRVGYALETATRPLFDRAPSESTLAHELAHQWYGDTVTLRRWRDIWLNEGFAEFSAWLWTEHTGGPSAAQRLRRLMNQPASAGYLWNPPPGNPESAKNVFSDSVYERGAATLQALREKVGDHTFFRIMRRWLAVHRYGNAEVGQFTAFAARLAHRDLTPFFRNWLYRHGKPRF
ncbi:MAG TPA: M1 family metallopeptidase [Jatrophihabitans sp.]|nr:M1 family metallopeptidase [Jatrophihabitans sp.]